MAANGQGTELDTLSLLRDVGVSRNTSSSHGPQAGEREGLPLPSRDQPLPVPFEPTFNDRLLQQSLRFLVTVVFVVSLLATIWTFHNKGTFDANQKNLFNVANLGLSLGLGLNVSECFRESGNILRPRLRTWAQSDWAKNAVEGFGSIHQVLYLDLGAVSKGPNNFSRKWLRVLFFTLWILLFLSEQSTIALFNLEYKTRDGADWNSTYTQNGTVNATHLGCYFSHSDPEAQCPTDVVVGQATANLYGEIGLASDCGNYTDISEVVNSREYKNYYCRRTPGRQEFTFRFYEFNPDDSQRTYPFFTNRTVSASAGECIVYQTVNQTHGLDLYGDLAATKYTFTNGTFTDSISIPKSNDGLNGTTFIYRGIDPPGDAFSPSVVCGLRCLWIWVHKTQGPNDNSTFYSCPITIDEVRNASFPHQQINITMARTAAASIALHGGWTGTFPNQTFTSFNFYAAGTDWDVQDSEDPSTVGARIAEFAIASLSTMAFKNPSVQVASPYVPHLGTSLQVDWPTTIGLFVVIVGLHAVVAFSSIWAVKGIN